MSLGHSQADNISDTLVQRLTNVHQRIAAACERVGRSQAEVELLLVTKTLAADRIREAAACGETLLGENKVQEALAKAAALHDQPQLRWQFIGHLQRNKIRDCLRVAEQIQSVDRLSLADALNRQLEADNRILPVLIQVNTARQASQFGVAPEAAIALIEAVSRLPALRVRGLMTIGPMSSDPTVIRQAFRQLRHLRDEVTSAGLPNVRMQDLSMGMSDDFELAIEEGATLVRLGRVIFGDRPCATLP